MGINREPRGKALGIRITESLHEKLQDVSVLREESVSDLCFKILSENIEKYRKNDVY